MGQCPCCLEPLVEPTFRYLGCKHGYHLECFWRMACQDEVLEPTCAICRCQLSAQDAAALQLLAEKHPEARSHALAVHCAHATEIESTRGQPPEPINSVVPLCCVTVACESPFTTARLMMSWFPQRFGAEWRAGWICYQCGVELSGTDPMACHPVTLVSGDRAFCEEHGFKGLVVDVKYRQRYLQCMYCRQGEQPGIVEDCPSGVVFLPSHQMMTPTMAITSSSEDEHDNMDTALASLADISPAFKSACCNSCGRGQ